MAKKKKKAAKKASGAAAGLEFNEAELHSAEIVMCGAEGLLRSVEYLHFDINAVFNAFPVTVQEVSQTGGTSGAVNVDAGLDLLHRWFIRRDFYDMPYLRVFGRVMGILLNHRGFQTCTAGDVFMVFLVEIPAHMEEHHRQNLADGQEVDVSMQPARRTFNNRMERMCREQLARPTVTLEAGRDEAYVLMEDGQTLFGDWPPLNDIPGLELHGPVTPENSARRHSRRRPRRRS
jgi:hypothetical protein